MTEKGWIAVAMWLAYGAGTVALALNGYGGNAELLGIFGALILAIATVRLFRKG